jgi:hypothetical protein
MMMSFYWENTFQVRYLIAVYVSFIIFGNHYVRDSIGAL